MSRLSDQIFRLEKQRDYYKAIARAYRALKGKTLETCPESCKKDFERRLAIINEWEERKSI